MPAWETIATETKGVEVTYVITTTLKEKYDSLTEAQKKRCQYPPISSEDHDKILWLYVCNQYDEQSEKMLGYIFYKHLSLMLQEERNRAREDEQTALVLKLEQAIAVIDQLKIMH